MAWIVKKHLFSMAGVLLLAGLAACVPGLVDLPAPAFLAVTPSPTDCGCTLEGTALPTPTGGFVLGGPAGPAVPGSGLVSPTPDLAVLKDQWPVYSDEGQRFSFAYPAVYNSPNYRFCAARTVEDDPGGADFMLALGSRTEMRIFPAQGQSIEAAAAAYQADPNHQDLRFDPPLARTVGPVALPAVTLPYRMAETNRYGESTFFLKGDRLFRVDTGAPSACDVPEINLRELDVYARLLETFQ